jgi:outer membrane protein OmpA-like peptidoglycan-associated protein
MKQSIPITFMMVTILFAWGCATKKYVHQTVDPVSGKLDQVATQTNRQGKTLDETKQSLDQTKETLEKDETALNATNERAVSADNRAGQAIDQANQANRKADKLGSDLGDLRNTVANLDDYKQVAGATVNFRFDSDKLSDDAKHELDQMVVNQNQYKRFFIAVEGFTDSAGSVDYNNALSRRRADAVVEYLVAEHDIPIYRIHMVGLGKQKPVEEARTRAAQAKNRRVEVTLFSADQSLARNGASAQASN